MRRGLQLAMAISLLVSLAGAGEVLDRIVARVGHRVILLSEVEDSLRYQALVEGRGPGPFTPDERKQAIDRLVDQALIEEQIDRTSFRRASQADVERQISELRKQVPGAAEDRGWRALLARYDLTPQDVEELVVEQVDIFRYVDGRFRPNIRIDKRSVESYYFEQFVPQLQKNGAREVPLDQVYDKIEEILVQQRINELMELWLKNLRLQGEVQVR